jgi:hypothetical protein
MTWPRFHLSTLVLATIFVSAMIGLWINRDVWQLEARFSLRTQDWYHSRQELKLDPLFGKLGIDYEKGNALEQYQVSPTDPTESADTRNVNPKANPTGVRIFRGMNGVAHEVDRIPGEAWYFTYTSDGKRILTDNGELWMRTRAYGWQGWAGMPLFWVAIISGGALSVVVLRVMINMR